MKKIYKNHVNQTKDKALKKLNQLLESLSTEGMKALRDLGVKSQEPSLQVSSIQEMLADIAHANQNPKTLLRNLDIATYEARRALQWNTRMLCALAKQSISDQFKKNLRK